MHALRGFFIAVVAASACLVTVFNDGLIRLRFSQDDFPLIGFEVVLSLVVVSSFSVIPWLLARKIAQIHHISSVFYYLGWGLILALLGDASMAASSALSSPFGDPDRLSFHMGFIRFLPMFLTAGAGGSLTYWIVEGRKVKLADR